MGDEKVVLRWMTAEETLKIAGIIDEVNSAMLENILTEENDAFVFFYDKSDPEAHTILEELEQGRRSVLSWVSLPGPRLEKPLEFCLKIPITMKKL